jgi:hypothetical protein
MRQVVCRPIVVRFMELSYVPRNKTRAKHQETDLVFALQIPPGREAAFFALYAVTE